MGCETVIEAKLDAGPTQLSVDGWITDKPGPQTIRVTQTAQYFDNGPAPAAVGATVTVTDNLGKTYAFTDPDKDSYYVWTPTAKDTLGRVGRTYKLAIAWQGETYQAISVMNRTPTIDSIIFVKKKPNPFSTKEGYQAEFFARDLPGGNDYYRVQFWQNGVLQNKRRNLITVQNAAFRGSADTDGLQFIRPIRQSINPDSLYALNDEVRVEVQSVNADAFLFLQELAQQIGNGGLFATPPANLATNILNTNPNGRTATGYFVATAVRTGSAKVVAATIRAQ